ATSRASAGSGANESSMRTSMDSSAVASGVRIERATFHRALIVANPIAGRGRSQAAARELAEGLGRRGIACETYLTASRDDARVKLRCASPDVDLVVAIGGDG